MLQFVNKLKEKAFTPYISGRLSRHIFQEGFLCGGVVRDNMQKR